MDDARLASIESKLDKLSDAVVSLARMEERMLNLFKRIEKYEEKQQDLENRVYEIEMEGAGKNSVIRIVDKLFWLAVGIGIAVNPPVTVTEWPVKPDEVWSE